MARTAEDDPGESGLEPGRRQMGDYVLGRQIGAGGMGVVYEARRLSDDRQVALKVIRAFHLVSPTHVRRFTLEAEAIARLDHPHIVRIHEVGECDGQPFFCMDFVDGGSLSAQVEAAGRRPQDETVGSTRPAAIARLMAKVARAVHHAHGRGVLHRDLKPGNILIDAQGEPRLTDFGLAKILQPEAAADARLGLTTSGDLPGTPNYMAPEQIAGGVAGYASDLYGLGAVLYALLTGRPPFQAPTPWEVFKHIVDQAPTRPRLLSPSIPPDLETICLKCLEKNPRHRHSSAEALAEDLERFAEGRPIHARAAGPVRRTGQWIRRNPVGTALIARTVWAKARLAEAGLGAKDLRVCTNIADQGAEGGATVISVAETLERVRRGDADAGVTHRSRFERYQHWGLVKLDQFPETPNVLAARAGLDPKVIDALRSVIRSHETSGSWPESKFVADQPTEKGSPGAAWLEALRGAVRQAEQFEGQAGH